METIDNIKLSIIIAYYNTYDLTCKLLEVLIPQITDEVEVLLIDDGCNEKRFDVYSKIKIIHLEQNKGGAYASNVGIDTSKGKYIAFVDSDDMISTDYVDTLLGVINNHNEDLLYLDWQDINTYEIYRRPDNYAQWKAIYRRDIIPHFPSERRYSYDVPFYDELKRKGFTKYYIDKVLYYYNSNRPGCLTLEKKKIIENERNNK